MPNLSSSPTLLSILVFLLTPSYVVTITKRNPINRERTKRIAMRLIHQDSSTSSFSIHEPKPDVFTRDYITRLARSSSKRFLYLRARMEREFGFSDFQVDIRSSSIASMFYVNFSIGNPPVTQSAIMDTGSSLLWIQCVPCSICSKQSSPMLDPSISSSFSLVSCTDPLCRYAPYANCSSKDECTYQQLYVNGAGSKGILAREQISFETSGDDNIVLKDIAFGCGHENGKHDEEQFTGIFALGTKRTSLAVQLGSRFSYCIGDIYARDYTFNKLVIGEEADMLGYSTPIDTSSGGYYLTLEGISVGETRLVIDPVTFRRKGHKTGVLIDSGTVFTWLAEDAYRALFDEIKSLLDPWMKRFWYRNYLCYNGKLEEDLTGFPVVSFHFLGGADLELEAGGTFFQVPETGRFGGVFCMAIRPSTDHGKEYRDFTAIGLMAQQFYNVGYDLMERNLYFQRMDCQLLDDY